MGESHSCFRRFEISGSRVLENTQLRMLTLVKDCLFGEFDTRAPSRGKGRLDASLPLLMSAVRGVHSASSCADVTERETADIRNDIPHRRTLLYRCHPCRFRRRACSLIVCLHACCAGFSHDVEAGERITVHDFGLRRDRCSSEHNMCQ